MTTHREVGSDRHTAITQRKRSFTSVFCSAVVSLRLSRPIHAEAWLIQSSFLLKLKIKYESEKNITFNVPMYSLAVLLKILLNSPTHFFVTISTEIPEKIRKLQMLTAPQRHLNYSNYSLAIILFYDDRVWK